MLSDPYDTCLELLECRTCGRVHGRCSEVNAQLTGILDGFHNPPVTASKRARKGEITWDDWQANERKKEDMILKDHYNKETGRSSNTPFLKADDIPSKGLIAKITGFREAPKQMQYSDFCLDITSGKKEFTVGLKSQSVLLNMLIDELGDNTDKWTGKSVTFVRGGAKGQYVNLKS